MISRERLETEYDLADRASATLRSSIGRLRAARDEATALDYGLLDPAAYAEERSFETEACLKIDDAISYVQIALEDELTVEGELDLYRSLRDLASRPGDIIGKLDERTYELSSPWTDSRGAPMLQGYIAGIVADTLPHVTARFGHGTATRSNPQPTIDTALPANRTPIVRTVRAR